MLSLCHLRAAHSICMELHMSFNIMPTTMLPTSKPLLSLCHLPVVRSIYEGWNFNSGNYLFTTDTK